jgi:hypothetical protein
LSFSQDVSAGDISCTIFQWLVGGSVGSFNKGSVKQSWYV